MSFKPAHGFLYRSFCLENKLTMFISENHCDLPDINADQRHGSFSARFRPYQTNTLILEEKIKLPCQSVVTENKPPKSYLFQNKPKHTSLSMV